MVILKNSQLVLAKIVEKRVRNSLITRYCVAILHYRIIMYHRIVLPIYNVVLVLNHFT